MSGLSDLAGKIARDCSIMRGGRFIMKGGRFIMKGWRVVKAAVLTPWLPAALGGCAVRGAPSFVVAGAYFPGWMVCALLGIVAAIAARIAFVASGLAGILPFQLFVCSAIGLSCGLLAWLLWFGH